MQVSVYVILSLIIFNLINIYKIQLHVFWLLMYYVYNNATLYITLLDLVLCTETLLDLVPEPICNSPSQKGESRHDLSNASRDSRAEIMGVSGV